MKTSKIFAVAALSLATIVGAHAEEYQGVQAPTNGLSRAEVQREAVAAAHAPNQNIPLAAISIGALSNPRDRAGVQAEAVAAAHDHTQNLNRSAFVNSEIPATLRQDSVPTQRAGL